MAEVEIFIRDRIDYYKNQFNEANTNDLKAHKAHYYKCVKQLNKMLEILIKDEL